ncbi:MAG: hypothetical protein A3A33_04615 [Candidatus Yanofskybacteria bacterium RIFCSPLOWO2_01_FULL_49_25]|uniref:Transcription regulator TrmB N-terminal domain-containing protein n=1 Tax=Candidatus Yanofskybacteria bacterium RIFCSPLOWO2_01_FULL_49_25 TaxID=1802701 RepID=A0A1F8GSC3_9BACT|nr:MAG: hypothetical protein A3A33_04615 [Candidatus Yanofskybacteria bacterium RIFCSPLOWO2_01_FULL_49_25]
MARPEKEQQVLMLFHPNEGLNGSGVSAKTGIASKDVYIILRRLTEKGLLRKRKVQRLGKCPIVAYTTTPEGASLARKLRAQNST